VFNYWAQVALAPEGAKNFRPAFAKPML